MAQTRQYIASILLHSAIAEWVTTLSLIFGGCCSNAWALELATSQNPYAGSLITFAQFVLVSLYGLRKHLTVAPISTAREQLLRTVASNVLDLCSRQPAAEQIYVAVEGPHSVSSAFAEDLAHEIDVSSQTLTPKRQSRKVDVKSLSPQLDGTRNINSPGDVVLVNGEDFHASLGRWDYFISLIHAQGSTSQIASTSPLMQSSLTVDVSSHTHPIIVSPVSTGLSPRTLFNIFTRVRLRKRSIPLSRWAVQVVLFLVTSLLNNAAFGYNVPMAVHIIFRSGGLVVNMLMGWLIDRRRYNATQVISVVLVTFGVICTTLSATQSSPGRVSTSSSSSPGSYFVGILILTLALVMSGFMGLAQDKAYAKYGRGHWQEAMFYLHFLALPGFTFVWRDLVSQIRIVNTSVRVEVGLDTLAMPFHKLVQTVNMTVSLPSGLGTSYLQQLAKRRLSIPSFYFPLLLNIVTQLVCVSGVHRLTSRVNSLTVTLVLVVRKAVSLCISVILLKRGTGSSALLWGGAALVLAGTIGYTVGGSQRAGETGQDTKKDE